MRIILLAALLAIQSAEATTRSAAAKRAFVRQNACPSTQQHRLPCPGYVIDHIIPLDCEGFDVPENMQYQTVADAKAKDKWERNGPSCKHQTKGRE